MCQRRFQNVARSINIGGVDVLWLIKRQCGGAVHHNIDPLHRAVNRLAVTNIIEEISDAILLRVIERREVDVGDAVPTVQ